MKLVEFLQRAREALLKKIESCGDDPEKLYPPKTARDEGDRHTSSVAARFMGVEAAGKHEIWLTLWSKNTGELSEMEEMAGVLSHWEETTDPESEATYYQRLGGVISIILAFDESDGSATFISAQKGRTIPFKNRQFLERSTTLIDEAIDLLGRVEGFG